MTTDNGTPHDDTSRPSLYEIRIQGHLEPRWAERFSGLEMTLVDNDTVLTGEVVDQAALHGLLKVARDLGLVLLSVVRQEPGAEDDSSARQA